MTTASIPPTIHPKSDAQGRQAPAQRRFGAEAAGSVPRKRRSSAFSLAGLVYSVLFAANAIAGPTFAWWQTVSPGTVTNYNGSINLATNSSGSKSFSTNPTGATLSASRTANIQPPTVVVQASAGLRFVAIGSTCVSGTDTAAVSSADKRTLLTCGASNTWQITSRISLPVVTEGNPCNITTDGNGAADANGLLLSCQSGVWKRPSSPYNFGGTFIIDNGSCYVANPFIGGCGCPSGYSTSIISNLGWISASQTWTYICYK